MAKIAPNLSQMTAISLGRSPKTTLPSLLARKPS